MKKFLIGGAILNFAAPFILILLFFVMLSGNGENSSSGESGPIVPSETQQEFIDAVASVAMDTHKEYGIYPSVTIAQAILESAWGKSGLAIQANNLFGIKADSSWKGPILELPTIEHVNGGIIHIISKWRVYEKWEDSVLDHGKFLRENPRYEKAGVFESANYKEQVMAIHNAGYATDPNYTNLVCGLIESYELYKFDMEGAEDIENENNK